MELVLKYNKDKTELKVNVSVPAAKWAAEERVYTTDDVVEALANLDVAVTRERCTRQGGRLYNWTGQTSGTWHFELDGASKSETKPAKKTVPKTAAPKKKVEAPKPAPKKKVDAPEKTAAPKKTAKTSSTKDVLSRLKKS